MFNSLAIRNDGLINGFDLGAISNETVAKIAPVKALLDMAKEKGLKGQVERYKKQIAAIALESKHMKLLQCTYRWYAVKDVNLAEVSAEDGLLRSDERFSTTKLKDFQGNIPPSIVERIPNGLSKKAVVFMTRIDPIVAVKISQDLFIAIYQWD